MEGEKSSSQLEQEKSHSSLEKKIADQARVYEMEEFYHKIRVDLESALSGRTDYFNILQTAFSESEKTEKDYLEDFEKFGLIRAEKTEEIHLISCFRNSGYELFSYALSDRIDKQKSLSFILNAIKNYVKYKLGELIEVLALESHVIHFFVVQKAYIIAIVTTRNVTRDRMGALAIQMARIIRNYPNETPHTNPHLRAAIQEAVEISKVSLVREHHTLKIILIGDGAVGKTSIRKRYLGEGFQEDYQMTIGADLVAKKGSTIYAGGKQIKYVIWDLAGQPRFENVRKAYYQMAVGALVVFDMTRMESYQNIVAWMNELWRNNGRGPVPCVILGNKIDLCFEKGLHHVNESKITKFVDRLSQISEKYRGFKIHFLPTSAKTGRNIEQAFELLGESIIDFLATTKEMKRIKQ
jgi:small GTP-binding protein